MSENSKPQTECACATLERLDGASVPAYRQAFLQPATDTQTQWQCRVCGMKWQLREADETHKRPALLKLEHQA